MMMVGISGILDANFAFDACIELKKFDTTICVEVNLQNNKTPLDLFNNCPPPFRGGGGGGGYS